MLKNGIHKIGIDELLSADAATTIRQTAEAISAVQKGLYALSARGDRAQLNLLKIGTVFQIFFIDVLAAGKRPGDLTDEDWKNIANKVYLYAVMEDGQRYSEFVFSLYADYIDLSVGTLQGSVSEGKLAAIRELSETIRRNTGLLRRGELKETSYTEACLWLSLEAMIRLLSTYFTMGIPQEYAELLQSVSQFAFEYGRYVLYAKEQEILEQYIRNQHTLDEKLQKEYEEYLEAVQVQAEAFRKLIDNAFSPGVGEELLKSAALARAAGVKEEELLETVEDVDHYFLDSDPFGD